MRAIQVERFGGGAMMKHKVDIIVVLKKTIEVEADFESEALDQTYEKYADTTCELTDFDVHRDFELVEVKPCKHKMQITVN